MASHRFGKVFFVLSIFLVSLVISTCDGAATREILNSNRKEQKTEETAVAQPRTCSQLESLLNLVLSIPSAIIQIIGNLTSDAGNLFMKPGSGISLPGFNKGNSTKGCTPIDPLLIANIPGIFIAVPLVIVGIAILIGIIAAIVIAVGGLGGDVRGKFAEMMGMGGYGGYPPSVMSSYGAPVSTYGSPVSDSAYSRLSQNVDQATQDFNLAYDKYSALMSQPQQQTPQQQTQQSTSSVYYDKPSQYDGWNNNVAMKRMKQ